MDEHPNATQPMDEHPNATQPMDEHPNATQPMDEHPNATQPMDEHPNATRIRELFAAFRARDVESVRNAIAEDAVWHFPGRRGKLAGSHAGHAGIFAFLARVSELTDGTFELELEDVVANDRRAVALFRGRGRRNGRELDNPTCLKIHLEDGRAKQVWEFVWDLDAVDAFWS